MVDIFFPSVTHSPTKRPIFAHLLISVESFLAALSFLENLWDSAEHYPSIPALFCDTILRRDPYRDSYEISMARAIMEHIDMHHASISYEVNIELGSTFIGDPLPEVSDDQCRCPLQRLQWFNVHKNHREALAGEACTRLTEVEKFIASYRLIDPLTAAKYFHCFEHRIEQLVRHLKDFYENGSPTQHDHCCFVPPRARPMQTNRTNVSLCKL
jgi:hypothetical protein